MQQFACQLRRRCAAVQRLARRLRQPALGVHVHASTPMAHFGKARHAPQLVQTKVAAVI